MDKFTVRGEIPWSISDIWNSYYKWESLDRDHFISFLFENCGTFHGLGIVPVCVQQSYLLYNVSREGPTAPIHWENI